MKQSELFTKTERFAPKDEFSLNAQLLLRGGFIHKVMAGVYEYLPLGLRVLDKINSVIREEMNAVGGQEIHLSVLQDKETWNKTGRWTSAAEVMYQFKTDAGQEVGLGWTHEEPLTLIAGRYIRSYRDLPKAVYQIQTKFRNEPRARSGLLRGREFLMKDLYSFHASDKDLDEYYEKVAQAYENIFKRVGLAALRTLASGGLFAKFSDEFQVVSEAGEDTIFHCAACEYAANKEVAAELELKTACPRCGQTLETVRSIEVGNIFKLGTRFAEAFGVLYEDEAGGKKPVVMASYGIGPGRVMGTVVEVSHDAKGIVWPAPIAPFRVHLLDLGGAAAADLYDDLQKKGVEVLYDDREASAGEKFADADLLGIPYRAVISPKTEGKIELKRRDDQETLLITLPELLHLFTKDLAR